MKKQKMLNPIRVFLLLMAITIFNACETTEDPITPTAELGTVLWTYTGFNVNPEATDPLSITAPAIGTDGTIYVSAYDKVGSEWQNGKVHAINPDGSFKWASPDLGAPDIYAPAIGSDGTIYVICWSTVYALNPADGSIKWSYQPPADTNEQHGLGWLTLGNDRQIFFAHTESGAYGRKIYALNNSGQVLWKQTADWGAANLTVGVDGTLFAYWEANGSIRTFGALDPNNGTLKWSKIIPSTMVGSAISPGGDIVFSQSAPEKLVKLNASNGETTWEVDARAGYPTIAPDGSIGIINGDIYCYNPDGTLKWQSGSLWGGRSKIAIDSDGNCYGSITDHGNGNFQVFKSDGTLKWETYQDITALHCPAIGPNHVIYVTVSSVPTATLYAIQGDKPLASSGWPRDTGGNGNTCNINLN